MSDGLTLSGPIRVLVCGGRDFDDADLLADVLKQWNIRVMITGGASGADTLAAKYAASHGIMSVQYHAQWSKYGKSAGPRRNEAMLVEGKPDLVVAFPGGRGTADMVRRARSAGARVYEVHSVREPT